MTGDFLIDPDSPHERNRPEVYRALLREIKDMNGKLDENAQKQLGVERLNATVFGDEQQTGLNQLVRGKNGNNGLLGTFKAFEGRASAHMDKVEAFMESHKAKPMTWQAKAVIAAAIVTALGGLIPHLL